MIKYYPRSKHAARAVLESGRIYEQIAMFDRALEQGFINAVNRALPEVFPTVAALLARIALPA